jgi:VanZ family protein
MILRYKRLELGACKTSKQTETKKAKPYVREAAHIFCAFALTLLSLSLSLSLCPSLCYIKVKLVIFMKIKC